ncbi:hypothetical protein B7P43_G08672 [Cryptotermes secundus]|uniref:Uncharacterized protein n=1 Tax=Cryptotermes secundus TaxID=105785 RepID=A0A2J7PCA3_9NEOP|nr:hypothetical protein B7P43_G08672 [Cryptotermes secundus]
MLSACLILALILACGWPMRTLKLLATRVHMLRTRVWVVLPSGTSLLMTSGVSVVGRSFPFLKQLRITCR